MIVLYEVLLSIVFNTQHLFAAGRQDGCLAMLLLVRFEISVTTSTDSMLMHYATRTRKGGAVLVSRYVMVQVMKSR